MDNLFQRIRYIYQQEGLISLTKKVLRFLASLPFEYHNFYLQERNYGILDLGKAKPPLIEKISFEILSTKQQLDELVNKSIDLFPLDIFQMSYRLEKGALASLVFAGDEIANQAWIAMTNEAKDTLTNYPFEVSFSNKEAYTGDYWTNPKYRRKGLNTFAGYKREEYLIGLGVRKIKTIVQVKNTASLRAAAKHGTKVYSKVHYLRIFGLKFWKETPINWEDYLTE